MGDWCYMTLNFRYLHKKLNDIYIDIASKIYYYTYKVKIAG